MQLQEMIAYQHDDEDHERQEDHGRVGNLVPGFLDEVQHALHRASACLSCVVGHGV